MIKTSSRVISCEAMVEKRPEYVIDPKKQWSSEIEKTAIDETVFVEIIFNVRKLITMLSFLEAVGRCAVDCLGKKT